MAAQSKPLTPSRSLASTLPPEILEHILSFSFVNEFGGEYSWKHLLTPVARKKNRLALVCRSWRAPVQRLFFKRVLILPVQVARLAEAVRGPGGVGRYIEALEIQLTGARDPPRIAAEDLNHLLAPLTNLTNLHLFLIDGYCKIDFSALAPVPHLRRLNLKSDKWSRVVKSHRQILAATPNITSLALGVTYDENVQPPRSHTALSPVHLPSLTELSLQIVQHCKFFDKLELLDASTLSQINCLELDMQGPQIDSLPSLPLMAVVGSNLKELTLGSSPGMGFILGHIRDDTSILKACPRLETLIATVPIVLHHFPPTLTRIVLAGRLPHTLLKNPRSEHSAISQEARDWVNVKEVEVVDFAGNEQVRDLVKQSFAEKNVRLTIKDAVRFQFS